MNPQNTNIYLAFGWVGTIVLAVVIVAATAIACHILIRLARKVTHVASGTGNVGSILDNILRACIWACGAGALMYFCLDFDAGVIWGALGVGGIAVSLGAQTTISNLIGGLLLSFSREVEIGDWVSIGVVSGRIEDITWRKLKVEDALGNVHNIPNSLITSTTLTRQPAYSRISLSFVLKDTCDVETLLEQVPQVAQEALDAADIAYTGKKALFYLSGSQQAGILATLVICADRSHTDAEASNVASRAVLAYLKDTDALAKPV